MSEEKAEEIIRILKRKGIIFEPQQGYLKMCKFSYKFMEYYIINNDSLFFKLDFNNFDHSLNNPISFYIDINNPLN